MVNSDQRRRQLAREKFERQQRRRAEARKAKRRNVIIASTLAVVVAAGVGAYATGLTDGAKKKDDKAAEAAAPPSPSASESTTPEPKMAIDASAKYTMLLKTDQGDIPVAMDAKKTPHTVNSFKSLADKGFFDKTKCHRLTTQGIHVLQCGDPKGDGTGGPGYTIEDENLQSLGKAAADGLVTYKAGTVAMANTGQPHTGGSQFFLVYKDSKLPPAYTPFGTMDDEGLKAVETVAKAGVEGGGGDGPPKTAVTVEKATVDKV